MAETWNADNPKIGNDVTGDVADIEENLDYLIHRFGYRADKDVTDHGNVATAGSIRKLMYDATAVSATKQYVIFLPHHMKDGDTTDYRFQQDWDATTYTNCVLWIQPGARITIDNAVTVTWGGPVIAPHKLQWLSLTGTGAFTWIWNGLVWGNYDGTATNAIHPTLDNTIDLGTSALEFKDLYIDGTANIDSLVADTADIDGGTIDDTAIGGTTPAAGAFTALSLAGAITGATGINIVCHANQVVCNDNEAVFS
jgi:hypothetical protein